MLKKLLLPALLASAFVVSCSPMMVDPEVSITPSPRTIDGLGQVSTVKVSATDTQGKPGTGTVTVTSAAGSLKAGTTVTLTDGEGSVEFTCVRATEPECLGSVKLSAEYVNGGKTATASTSLTVSGPIVVGDGGVDAGVRLDGGTFDGGFSGDYALELSTSKTTLIAGAADSTSVVVRFFTNTTQMVPVAETVSLQLTNGASFSATGAQTTSTVMTDAVNGVGNVTVYAGTASGPFQMLATARDAQRVLDLTALNVQRIAATPDGNTLTTLNVQDTGINTSTQIAFTVYDGNNMPIPGVQVSFAVSPNSAAGCAVAPTSAVSNMAGVVRTTLSSGSSAGAVSVTATVLGINPATFNGSVVVGIPSDEKLLVVCDRKTLGALQSAQPPRIDQQTTCTANFADRNGARPAYPIQVTWLSEAGQVTSMSSGTPGLGFATTSFTTNGNLPTPTDPMVSTSEPSNPTPGNPNDSTANPRDGFVTIVAAMAGEEQFWDSPSGNGKWDPGEWFVDLAEPYVDRNDNGQYDTGEAYIDTDRVDCATGQKLPKNGHWDPPNGCWDSSTQIWASTHVVYSGSLVGGSQNTTFVKVVPPFPVGQVLPLNWASSHDVTAYDSNLNRLSSDALQASVGVLAGTRGSALVTTQPVGGESFGGNNITHRLISASETSPGVFTRNGTCDHMGTAAYPQTRCIKETSFGPWAGGTTLTVGINGAGGAQAPLPDGGVPAATTTQFQLRVQNALQAGPSTTNFTLTFE